MNLHIRYVGAAQLEWNARNAPETKTPSALNPMMLMTGDLLTHQDFPQRWLVVLARHIDLIASEVTLYVDLLHAHQSPPNFPDNVLPIASALNR